MKAIMKAINIEWDVDIRDFDDEAEYEAVIGTLPEEVELPEAIFKGLKPRDCDDEVADYLSDEYGYCVRSFALYADYITATPVAPVSPVSSVSSFCQSLIDFAEERRTTII